MIKILSSLIPKPKPIASGAIQSLGTVGSTVTVAAGYTKFTTGTSNITLNLQSPADTGTLQRLTVAVIQGATSRSVTLGGSNIISAGGLVSSGKVLPNSGANKTDVFVFEWTGTAWECIDLRFDIR